MRRTGPTLAMLVVIALLAPRPARGEDGAGPSLAEISKVVGKAFRPLGLARNKDLLKELGPRLPDGVVIEAAPFDRLVEGLLREHRERLADREAALDLLARLPSAKAGSVLEKVFTTLDREEQDLAAHVAAMEADYAEVYNRGYMESSEQARRTRKAAAVLIPFYRSLQARGRALDTKAVEVLAAFKEGEAFAWLRTAAARAREPRLRVAAVRALGRIGGDDALEAVRSSLQQDGEAGVRWAALAALCAWPLKAMKDAVPVGLADAAWEVRALAVGIAARGRLVDAAGALVDALAKEEGRLRQDIDDALFALVGARMYGDVALWRRWLEENQTLLAEKAAQLAAEGAWDAPLGPPEEWPHPGAAVPDEEARKRGGTAAFYGITSLSKRILLVIDISRSMQDEAAEKPPRVGDAKHPYAEPLGGSKMDIARWQLHRVVHDLPEDALFNIVVYSESYKVWEEAMTPARKKAKKAAHAFIDQLVANGTTNIGDSLDKALALARPAEGGRAADTVYLLSDGDPNRGRLSVLSELLADFVRRNARARLVVHTIGIGEAAGSSFLKELAEATGGQYVALR